MKFARVLFAAVLVGAASFSLIALRASTASASPVSSAEGIDVSHWQGVVDWSKVAASGKRFVFIKASDGNVYSDSFYKWNRIGAQQAGLLAGAYHFARPSGTTPAGIVTDARAEASRFLDLADPQPGDLLPVLDLENNDRNLSPSELKMWASAWLTEVGNRIGVKPLIYSGYYFFQDHMADTTAFANAGYMLWYPRYGVTTAIAPAANWGGRGWTIWQYTNEGRVLGISGNVDRNRLAASKLSSLRIPSFSGRR